MIINKQYFVEIKSIIRLLKLYLKKKNQCLPGYEQGYRPPPPAPFAMNFLFFLDIDLCTRSLIFMHIQNLIIFDNFTNKYTNPAKGILDFASKTYHIPPITVFVLELTEPAKIDCPSAY